MKDELTGLFREHFAGHEAPVDPGLWDAIQGQLGAGAPIAGEEGLKDLFQERFSGHEVLVEPGVWTGISSQLGHGVAATSTGGALTGTLGWAAAGVGILAIAGAAYFFSASSKGSLPEAIVRVEQPAAVAQAELIAPPISSKPDEKEVVAAEPKASTPLASPQPKVDSATSNIPSAAIRGPQPVTQPVPLPSAPEPTLTTPQGAVIVENIISELTTRVTEEVLAEAAQRTTLGSTATPAALEVDEPVSKTEQEAALPVLVLQNTFTPNGDGINDTYSVITDPEAFDRIMLRVYDVRNNRLVFSTNTNEPWTGDGCLDGYYLVAVEAVTPEGRLVTQGKVVWLNRNAVH